MNIKEDKELKFAIDKLIEYSNEIEEEMKILSKKKKELEKIIKSYIFNIQNIEDEKKLEICYESDYFYTYLNRKLKGKELYKVRKDNFQELMQKKEYESIEIKSSVQLIRILIKKIDECKSENEKIKCEEILAKYLNYINRSKKENPKELLDNDKIELLKYFINSNENEILYLKAKKYIHNNNTNHSENINENDYKIKITTKDFC